jgi:hypothetical protein
MSLGGASRSHGSYSEGNQGAFGRPGLDGEDRASTRRLCLLRREAEALQVRDSRWEGALNPPPTPPPPAPRIPARAQHQGPAEPCLAPRAHLTHTSYGCETLKVFTTRELKVFVSWFSWPGD